MKKTFLRYVCAAAGLCLVISSAGCGRKNTTSVISEIQYENVSGQGSGSSAGGSDGTESNSQGTSGSSGKNNSHTSSGNKGGTANNGTVNDNVDVKKYSGTKVRYATWIDPDTAEDGPVIKSFEKKYGIKVDIDLINQGTYINRITGLIASGNAPDVYFCNSDFPSCLPCLQPISAAKLNLKEDIWDEGMTKLSTFNGNTYLVNTVGNIWNEVDCLFYNKKLLNENRITTPDEYLKAGKWDYAALEKIMTSVKELGKSYIGGYIDYKCFIGSTGTSLLQLKNGKVVNGTNSTLKEAYRYLAAWYQKGLIRGTTEDLRDDFLSGKCGIAITNAYGLKKTGYWSTMNPDHIGFTYIPAMNSGTKAVTTGMFRGWGLIKGAKNPVGAGIFLRYYLDVNNYDTSSSFINSQAEDFFFKLTSGVNTDQKNPYFYLGMWGCGGSDYRWYTTPSTVNPAQVSATVDSMQNQLNAEVNKTNEFISKNTK